MCGNVWECLGMRGNALGMCRDWGGNGQGRWECARVCVGMCRNAWDRNGRECAGMSGDARDYEGMRRKCFRMRGNVQEFGARLNMLYAHPVHCVRWECVGNSGGMGQAMYKQCVGIRGVVRERVEMQRNCVEVVGMHGKAWSCVGKSENLWACAGMP